MQLNAQQIERFDREGYLFFDSLFSPQEVGVLRAEVPRLYAQRRIENVREKGSDAVRTNFAAHMYSAPFARLARHPRMIAPVVALFGEAVYMHQFKINGKMAFDGDVWQWHQDFGTWKNDDEMPEPRAMNIAIFLDEVNEFNGPLMFIPGSHKLAERAAQGRPLRVAMIGAGKFGAMYLAQVPKTPGVHIAAIADLAPAAALANLARVGWPRERSAAPRRRSTPRWRKARRTSATTGRRS